MEIIHITVTVTDNAMKRIIKYPLLTNNRLEIPKMHEMVSQYLFPDHWVLFEWDDDMSKIYGEPFSLKKDKKEWEKKGFSYAVLEAKYFPEKRSF